MYLMRYIILPQRLCCQWNGSDRNFKKLQEAAERKNREFETIPYFFRIIKIIVFRGGKSVEETKEVQKKSSFVLPVFMGLGAGAVLGLFAYVKDWF